MNRESLTDGVLLSRRRFTGGLVLGALGVSACGTDKPPAKRRTSATRYDAHRFGARGDGLTDDTNALQSAIDTATAAGGGIVELRSDVVGYVSRAIVMRSGVRLVSPEGSARLLKIAASHSWITSAIGAHEVGLSGLRLETRGLVHTDAVQVGQDVDGFTIESCLIQSDASTLALGIECRPGSQNIRIHNSTVDGFVTGIRINGSISGVRLDKNVILNWTERGIATRATLERATTDITIDGNTIGPNAPGGLSRQAIQFSNEGDNPFHNIRVLNNHVSGSATDDKDSARSGSADLISLHNCVNFEVRGNKCIEGGEVGITVARGSSKGVVADNECRLNDTSGICIGSSFSQDVTDILVEGNTCVGNGQNYGGLAPEWARSGVTVYEATRITIRDNILSTGEPDQVYGVSITGGTDITIGDNQLLGNHQSAVLRRVASSDAVF